MHFHIVTSTFYLLQQKMQKSSDPKTLVFVSWALKTSLGQFGPKAFSKGLIKPSWEPKLQFSQTGPQFFKNQEKNPIKSWNLKKMSSPWDLVPENYCEMGLFRSAGLFLFLSYTNFITAIKYKNYKIKSSLPLWYTNWSHLNCVLEL